MQWFTTAWKTWPTDTISDDGDDDDEDDDDREVSKKN